MKRKYFNIKRFLNGEEDVVSIKLKIINFYDKYGLKAEQKSFWNCKKHNIKESRFAFALAFDKLSSESAKEFMKKFLFIFP